MLNMQQQEFVSKKELSETIKDVEQKFNEKFDTLNEIIKNQKNTIKKLHEKADLNEAKYLNQKAEHELTTELLYQSNKNNCTIKTPFYHFCLDSEIKNLIEDYNRNAKQLQLHVVAHQETAEQKLLKLSFYITGHNINKYYPIQENLSCNSLLEEFKDNKSVQNNSELIQKIENVNNYLNFEFLAVSELFAKSSNEAKNSKKIDLNFLQFIDLCNKCFPQDSYSDLKKILDRFFSIVMTSSEELINSAALPNFKIGRTLNSESINDSARNGRGYSVIFKHVSPEELEYEKLIAKRNEQDSLCHIVILDNSPTPGCRIIAMLKNQNSELSTFELSSEKIKAFPFPQFEEKEQEKLIDEYKKNVNKFFESREVIKHLVTLLTKDKFIFLIGEIKTFMVLCRKFGFVPTHFEYGPTKQKSEQAILFDDIDQENIALVKNRGKGEISTFFETKRSDETLIITYRLYNFYKQKKNYDEFLKRKPVRNLLSNLVLLAAIVDKIVNAKTAYDNPDTNFRFWYMWTLTKHIKNYETMGVNQQNNLIGEMNIFKVKLDSRLSHMAKGGPNNYLQQKEETYDSLYGYR